MTQPVLVLQFRYSIEEVAGCGPGCCINARDKRENEILFRAGRAFTPQEIEEYKSRCREWLKFYRPLWESEELVV